MIAYVNGEYFPDEEPRISVHDRGLMFGDSVFDIARTYGGKPFRLEAHLERLRRSMVYVELDADRLIDEITDATYRVLALNEEAIDRAGDVFVEQIVTRGTIAGPESNAAGPATVIVKLRPVYFPVFAQYYDEGLNLHVSMLNVSFTGPLDPRAKAANRLANARAELKGARARQQVGGGSWTLLFNPDGSIPETNSANICIVERSTLVTPPRCDRLGGISLDTLLELAETVGLSVCERRIFPYDLLNADEAMITATSFGVLPVFAADGIPLGRSREMFDRLLAAWVELVGFDFVAQAKQYAVVMAGGLSQ